MSEKGIPDRLYIRYLPPAKISRCPRPDDVKACAEVLWIEWKRAPGGSGKRALFTAAEKKKIRQQAWIAAERARGALVLLAGVDFEASIEGFQKFYRASGLCRRKI